MLRLMETFYGRKSGGERKGDYVTGNNGKGMGFLLWIKGHGVKEVKNKYVLIHSYSFSSRLCHNNVPSPPPPPHPFILTARIDTLFSLLVAQRSLCDM